MVLGQGNRISSQWRIPRDLLSKGLQAELINEDQFLQRGRATTKKLDFANK